MSMTRPHRALLPLLPPLAFALLAGWCGTLWGGATAAGNAAALALLLALLGVTGAPWRDPLRLGAAGRLLPQLLWVWASLSWWGSPVRRAGTAGLVLLPVFLLLPAAVARCWRDESSRRQGLRALAVAVSGISLWALADRLLTGAPRAAMPLGHHTLLALCLVTLLPPAMLPLREDGTWRAVGALAGLAGIAAVLASGSLLGTAALVLQGLAWLVVVRSGGPHPRPLSQLPPPKPRERGEKQKPASGLAVSSCLPSPGGGLGGAGRGAGVRASAALVLLAIGLGAAVLEGPRLARIAAGTDASARARAVYWAAGWQGFLARPVAGWGPGAAAWTNALFLRPVPGVNPPGEAVGELHSLPLQIAYELGIIGLLLALGLAAVFAVRRVRDVRHAADPGLLAASLLGLLGAAVAFLGAAALDVAALPWAVAMAAGGCLAALPSLQLERETTGGRAFAAAAALALAPWVLAHGLYDRALAAEIAGRRPEAVAGLERAVRLDPGFPLYRMRLALLRNDAAAALRAAQDGHAVAALWTVAGVLGQASARPWAPGALSSACSLSPLEPLAPFFQGTGTGGTARSAAHALLAEPRLAAAVVWQGHEALLAAALEEVRLWEGVDAGWKESFLAAARRPPGREDGREWLALTLDTDPRESISVLLFRRRPWPAQWPVVPLRRGLVERLDMPPATVLPTTKPLTFPPSICFTTASHGGHRSVTWQAPAQTLSGGRSPQHLWKTLWESPDSKGKRHGETAVLSTLPNFLCMSINPFGVNSLKKTALRSQPVLHDRKGGRVFFSTAAQADLRRKSGRGPSPRRRRDGSRREETWKDSTRSPARSAEDAADERPGHARAGIDLALEADAAAALGQQHAGRLGERRRGRRLDRLEVMAAHLGGEDEA
jgi:O-antigen ligase